MPPKDLNIADTIILTPDGIRIRYGEIKELTIDEDKIIAESSFPFNDEANLEFSMTREIPADWIYFLEHGKLPTNNWRKMHRLPLRRKIRKRR